MFQDAQLPFSSRAYHRGTRARQVCASGEEGRGGFWCQARCGYSGVRASDRSQAVTTATIADMLCA